MNMDLMETENRLNPATTKKFEAYVAMRREEQTKKLQEEETRKVEDAQRELKQLRLTNRVKQSPALSNNQLALRKKRKHSI